MDRIVGRIQRRWDGSIQDDPVAALADHAPQVTEREDRMIKGGIGLPLVRRVRVTIDQHEGTNMAEAVFTFGRKLNSSNRGWVDRGPVIATVSSPVPRGAVAVETDDASNVDIGSWVVVQQYFW